MLISRIKKSKLFSKLFLAGGIVVAGLVASIYLRQNNTVVSPELNLHLSVIVDDSMHNGFPDLIFWNGMFYLAYRSAASHLDPKSVIKILRSSDGLHWEQLAILSSDEDIRDPKFANIGSLLFLYVLKNKDITADPYTTIYSTSMDGIHWKSWQDVSPENWVFWRPKTFDNHTWYVAADNREKTSALFRSTDGINWETVSTIYSGEFNAEIEIEFQPNQDLICTIRVDGVEGDPKTLIGSSSFPYSNWELKASHVTRLDGPSIFTFDHMLFASGRYEPDDNLFPMGSELNRKRTSLFLI